MSEQTIVGDSSPLIALAIIDQLELLARIYRQVLLPPAVWEEITVKGSGLPGAAAISRIT